MNSFLEKKKKNNVAFILIICKEKIQGVTPFSIICGNFFFAKYASYFYNSRTGGGSNQIIGTFFSIDVIPKSICQCILIYVYMASYQELIFTVLVFTIVTLITAKRVLRGFWNGEGRLIIDKPLKTLKPSRALGS